MKKLFVLTLCFNMYFGYAQILRPQSVSIGSYREALTHSGVKVSAVYALHDWEKTKADSIDTQVKQMQFQLAPALGFFYHKNYQTAGFFNPELVYSRKKENGNYISYGLGIGYMRTFLPHVYSLDDAGEIEKNYVGYNYFISTVSASFGRDFGVKNSVPLGIYLKPQCMYAIPNATGGILYFSLEAGITYTLHK